MQETRLKYHCASSAYTLILTQFNEEEQSFMLYKV